MLNKAVLAAAVAAGLILPEKAGIYLPPRPAIVKPQNIGFSKNLLAMPLTMGMLKSGARTPGAISYVGGGSSSGTTATTIAIPAHQAGDLILIIKTCANSLPAAPAGWSVIYTGNASNAYGIVGYRFATDSSTVSGTWTNSSSVTMAVAVYRNVFQVGNKGQRFTNINVVTSITWPAFTVLDTTNTKWIVGLGAAISTIASGQPNAPTGRTSRVNANYARIWDTNGPYAGNYVAQTSSTTSNYCYGGLYLTIELIP
jgi:hypothetical protein